MDAILPAVRPYLAGILALAFACGLMAPAAARAELSEVAMFGPGLRIRPAYDGSASRRTELVPIVRYYGQPWFLRSTQGVLEGGARFELAPGLHAGAQLAYEPGRKTSESAFLQERGLSNVDLGASVGVHLEWDHKFGRMPIALLARVRRHTDSDRGTQADLRLSAGIFQSGRFAAGVFAQTTWANAESTGSFYDITPQQSAATGLPAFNAGSGLLFSSFGLLWSAELSRHWIAVGNIESRHLHGDAARSPLAERDSNYYASAGVAYRF
ncbi:MAG: MipA/OmpV family protein [Burkholderiales bacterium]|nr:MipA/OmpV family protein [Burkholderiales bacterium]